MSLYFYLMEGYYFKKILVKKILINRKHIKIVIKIFENNLLIKELDFHLIKDMISQFKISKILINLLKIN